MGLTGSRRAKLADLVGGVAPSARKPGTLEMIVQPGSSAGAVLENVKSSWLPSMKTCCNTRATPVMEILAVAEVPEEYFTKHLIEDGEQWLVGEKTAALVES